jgi:hypothetical protein
MNGNGTYTLDYYVSGTDSCKGDSGGGLYSWRDGVPTLMGVVSRYARLILVRIIWMISWFILSGWYPGTSYLGNILVRLIWAISWYVLSGWYPGTSYLGDILLWKISRHVLFGWYPVTAYHDGIQNILTVWYPGTSYPITSQLCYLQVRIFCVISRYVFSGDIQVRLIWGISRYVWVNIQVFLLWLVPRWWYPGWYPCLSDHRSNRHVWCWCYRSTSDTGDI